MKYIVLGKTGMTIPKVTLGCWAIGAGSEWGKSLEDSVYMATMEKALDLGVNFFDTAQVYGAGHSEILVGNVIKDIRDKVVISTKALAPDLTEDKCEKTVMQSLKRLQTDYIDIMFLHWPHPDIHIERNVEQLQKLKDKGMIRAIGLSNITLKHMELASAVADLDVIQPCYNLFWRHPEKEIFPYCIKNNIGVITYTSIASGLLTGKFNKDTKFDPDDNRSYLLALFQPKIYEKAVDEVEKIKCISQKINKTVSQVVINWTMNRPGVTSAIVGAKTPAQTAENAAAADFDLSVEDTTLLNELGKEIIGLTAQWDTMYRKNDDRLKIKY